MFLPECCLGNKQFSLVTCTNHQGVLKVDNDAGESGEHSKRLHEEFDGMVADKPHAVSR